MNKKILIIGSIVAVVILVLISLPSVVRAQTMDDTVIDRLEDIIINCIQKDDRFKNLDVNELTPAIQHIKGRILDSYWYPGEMIVFLADLLLYIILCIWTFLLYNWF